MAVPGSGVRVDVLRLSNVRVRVAPKRIEDTAREGDFDAIVSSDDTMLSMSGGVSQAILAAAGQQVAREAAAVVPLRVGISPSPHPGLCPFAAFSTR